MFNRSVKDIRSLLQQRGKLTPEEFIKLTEGMENPRSALNDLCSLGHAHLEFDKNRQDTPTMIVWDGELSQAVK